jgi:hypothetical protein
MLKKSKDDKKTANESVSIPTTQILNIEEEKKKEEETKNQEEKSSGGGETKSVSINLGSDNEEPKDDTSSTSKKIIF